MFSPKLAIPLLLSTGCLPGTARRDAHLDDLDGRVAALEAENADLKSDLRLLDARVADLEGHPAAASPSPGGTAQSDASTTTHCIVRDTGMVLSGELDLAELSRSARVIPHLDGGGVQDGYRVSGVRPASLLATCGLENGDIVHAINGVALTSLDAASQAHASVLAARSATLDVVRRGQPETLTVHLPAP